jgi:hypothetical protein
MIGLLIGLVALFVSGAATFGGDLIYALGVMETWYQIILGVLGVIVVIIVVLASIGGGMKGVKYGKIGALFGTFLTGAFGMLIGVLIVFTIGIQLYIVDWLIGSIDPAITSFAGLTAKQMIGLVGLIIIPIIQRMSNSTVKTKSSCN